jgi:urate oxidase
MIFQISVLVTVLTGPFGMPHLVPTMIERNFISVEACETFRTTDEFTKSITDMRADISKHVTNIGISVASKCVDIAPPAPPKDGAHFL